MKNKKKNPFENFKEPQEINKAEVFGALKNYNNSVMIKKTGKEIKDHIQNVILPFLLAKKEDLKLKIDTFLSNTIVMPSSPCWTRIRFSEEEFPYKQYSWEESNWIEKSFGYLFKGFGDCDEECEEGECIEKKIDFYYPQNKEEAKARSEYNKDVEDYRDILMDIKTANVLIANLKDTDEYFLNLEQLTALNFDEV